MVLSQSTHCALVILAELANNYGNTDVLFNDIAERNHIPLDILNPIAERLCGLEIILSRESDDDRWLRLKSNPSEISVYNIVMLFDGDFFSGHFMDLQSGRVLPKSKVSHIINLERMHIIQYMRKRLKKLNLRSWAEQAQKQNAYYHIGD